MDFAGKILEKTVEHLSGFDLWFALSIALLGAIGWFWLGLKKKIQKRLLTRQLILAFTLLAVAVLSIASNHYFFLRARSFPAAEDQMSQLNAPPGGNPTQATNAKNLTKDNQSGKHAHWHYVICPFCGSLRRIYVRDDVYQRFTCGNCGA